MKAYTLTEADFDRLLLMVDRDPKYGANGGSSDAPVRDRLEEQAHYKAHRFYNYQVREWLDEVRE